MTSSDLNLKQLQSEQTRADLIQAATRLLLRKGYGGTTMALLASEVRMTKGAIYHHFRSKQDIVRAVIEHVRATWDRQVGARIPTGGDALARLGALFDYQADLINADPSLCLLVNGLMLEPEAVEEEIMVEVRRVYTDLAQYIQGILTTGQKAGVVRSDLNAATMAQSLAAVIKGISCSREAEPSDRAFVRKMQTTKTIVLSGLRK